MIVVIFAGGSGTRLWPLSTPGYPKHLLQVNGDTYSLMQHAYRRARKLTDSVYILSEAGHIQHVKDQLPELDDEHFIVEPARRGTASCIIAALAYLEKRHDPDEPIVSIAADHYIRDVNGFAHSFKVAESVSREHGRLVLVGVEPDHPATGFGYIEKGELLDEQRFVFNVNSFKEKPDYSTARRYVESGNYLWNCSYFMASPNTFKRVMQEAAPEMLDAYRRLSAATDREDYERIYLDFENIAIDYALIEKVKDLLVVPASFDWMDLGSFADMARAVDQDEDGNHFKGLVEIEDVSQSYIQNEEDNKPVAVIGLDNVVVINTPAGILVARKDLSQKVGEISKRFQKK
jgi:mannose-1-phosphate guanylyltransferase